MIARVQIKVGGRSGAVPTKSAKRMGNAFWQAAASHTQNDLIKQVGTALASAAF
jgi:hypothetical protein